jgi:hypothetical protein
MKDLLPSRSSAYANLLKSVSDNIKPGTLIIILLVSSGGPACAFQQQELNVQQEQTASVKGEPQSRVELAALISDARSVPSEFASDALIRIAESNKINAKTQKRELLEEAFRLASSAQRPIRRVGLPGSLVDTRSGYLSLAYARKLDTFSLQLRAVKAMLAVDKAKARQLFTEIPKLQLQPLRCEDALVYDVSDFYDTLDSIAQTTFSREEKEENLHFYLVQSYVDGMTSPVQIGPIAKVILSVGKDSPAQLSQLVRAFNMALVKISGDDRSFSFSISQGSGGRGITELVAACREQGIPTDDLLNAAREYFVRHLRGSRCADNVDAKDRTFSDPNYINHLNSLLLEADPGKKTLTLIAADDMRPSAIKGVAEEYPYWQSPEAQRLLLRLKKLRFGSGTTALTTEQKKDADWQSSLREMLDDLTAWDGSKEKSEADFFHQKSILFEGLLGIIPSGSERDSVLTAFISFLNKPHIQQDSRIDWFLHMEGLVKATRSFTEPERSEILKTLNGSGDPIIQLYANLETLLPSTNQLTTR